MIQKIDCKAVQEQMIAESNSMILEARSISGPQKPVSLGIIQVGTDPASDVYVRNKIRLCEKMGVVATHIKISDGGVNTHNLYSIVRDTIRNANKRYSGVLLQLPLPDKLKDSEHDLINVIDSSKDVDGLTNENVGKLWNGEAGVRPCTAAGIARIIPTDLSGKKVCIIGRSRLVGKPLAKLCMDRNAAVTICHTGMNWADIGKVARKADILVVAIGRPKYVNIEPLIDPWKSKIVIDVGINRDEDGKLCGDIDWSSFYEQELDQFVGETVYYTSVPGGVGLLTTGQMMLNLAKLHYDEVHEQYEG